MKKSNLIIALMLLGYTSVINAQTVRVGNQTNGITASGNSLSINSGNNSVQVGNVPAWMAGVTNAAQATMQETSATLDKNADGSAKSTAENQAKIEAAKNNFLKQKQDLIAQAVVSSMGQQNNSNNNTVEQTQVKIGQNLNVLKSNLVTNNIAFYNKTTINQTELKAQKEAKKGKKNKKSKLSLDEDELETPIVEETKTENLEEDLELKPKEKESSILVPLVSVIGGVSLAGSAIAFIIFG